MRRVLLVAAAAAALVAGLMSPASAYTVRPSTASLMNFRGEQAGCLLSATPPGPSATSFVPGDATVAGYTVACDDDWWYGTQAAQRLVLIGADGHRERVLVWNEGTRWTDEPSAEPVTFQRVHPFVPCLLRDDVDEWVLPLGQSTVLDGTEFAVQDNERGGFIASVEQEVPVTCTEADRATAPWPMSTSLRDDAGADSGCVFEVRRIELRYPEPDWAEDLQGWLHVPDYLHCQRTVRAYRYAFTMAEFDADGSRTNQLRYGLQKSYPSAPINGQIGIGATNLDPCLVRTDGEIHEPGTSWLGFRLPLGHHWLTIGGRVTIKTGKYLRRKWKGSAEQITQVICTTDRRAYR